MSSSRIIRQDEKPPAELGAPDPGKKWVKSVKNVDGHPVDEWIQVDDVEGPAWGPNSAHTLLNKDILRYEGADKVTGKARYSHDARPEGMLFGKLIVCKVPCARFSFDLAPALKIDGVEAAISMVRSEDGYVTSGETRFLGEPLAAIAARTPELAEDGARAIRMEIEELPWAVSYEAAVAPDAPAVTASGNVREDTRSSSGDRDEAESALEACEHSVEGTYVVPVQHHVCLETHGIVCEYTGGDEATIHATTQVASGFIGRRSPTPEILGLKQDKVRVLCKHMGGGFGSKFGEGPESIAAVRLSKETNKPVHLLLARDDEFLVGGNRSGGHQTVKAGCDKNGVLKAMVSDIAKLGGIGRGSNPGLPYIYDCETAYRGVVAVHTNTDSSRAMRAPGHPQASFAMESVLDELAYAAGIDPLDFRKTNLSDPVYHRQLDRAAKEIGWFEHANRTKPGDPSSGDPLIGIGFGIATWGGGGRGGNEVEIKIMTDGSVTSSVGTQDLGTGVRTYVAAIPAEELGLDVRDVTPNIGDNFLGRASGSGGSTTTASLAPSVKVGAYNAAQSFKEHLGKVLGKDAATITFANKKVLVDGDEVMSWDQACATLPAEGLTAQGTWQADLQASGVHGAQAAKVQVDPLTGELKVLKMVAVQDQGLILNRLATRSQLNGGMIQALSYALFEERVIDEDLGLMLNANLESYKIAGCREMPELVPILDDDDMREQVIGMAEPAVIPGASAIANAVYNACGVRLRELPLTADKILMGLQGA